MLPFCQGPGHGTGYQDQIIIEARDFLRAIETKTPVWPTFADGMAVNQVVAAAMASSRAKAWVDVAAFEAVKGTHMTIKIGNAPCSWGIEFPSDPPNPTWQSVLDQCAGAGYKGIELGPIGYMPEDPAILAPALGRARSGDHRRRGVSRRFMTRRNGMM